MNLRNTIAILAPVGIVAIVILVKLASMFATFAHNIPHAG